MDLTGDVAHDVGYYSLVGIGNTVTPYDLAALRRGGRVDRSQLLLYLCDGSRTSRRKDGCRDERRREVLEHCKPFDGLLPNMFIPYYVTIVNFRG